MSGFEQLLGDAIARPLEAARRQSAHGQAIGYLGAEVPVELIRAGGAFALRVPGGMPDSTARADALLESSFMPEIRAVAESYLAGDLDFLTALVFSRSNDSVQRLYYYLCELQRTGRHGPRLLIYDLAKIPRATSLAHTVRATESLAMLLQATCMGLADAIAGRNRRAALLERAHQLRLRGSLLGSTADRLARAAGSCDPQRFDEQMGAWLDERSASDASYPGPRLLLAGNAAPDERLHRMVEEAGGNVVTEFGEHAFFELLQLSALEQGTDLALAYHTTATGPRAFLDRAGALKQRAFDTRVQGVISWLVLEEDAYIWDLPSQRDALAEAGIAHLILTQRRWDATDDTRRQIHEFVRQLSGAAA